MGYIKPETDAPHSKDERNIGKVEYVYEKCVYCGSTIVRRADEYSVTDSPAYAYACGYARRGGGAAAGKQPDGAGRYGLKLYETGCASICVLYDTHACNGDGCGKCEVSEAGLCCKKYLLNAEDAYILEKDGGDYHNLMGAFFSGLDKDAVYDEKIRKKLLLETERANNNYNEIRKRVAGGDTLNSIFERQDYLLDDFMLMLPYFDKRPVRIEIQILIYIFHFYRCSIDLTHVENRFKISGHAINRYLRAFFGYSYSGLLAKIRNGHSKALLAIPLFKIGEIGALVGYKSHNHYSLNFKRYEGVTPKQYRHSVICAEMS